MKTILNISVVTLISMFFISCSNMTIGFEEDSPLYNGPLVDTREDVNGEKVSKINSTVSEEKTQNAVVEDESKAPKTEEKNIKVPKETASQESQTTFTYERDDE